MQAAKVFLSTQVQPASVLEDQALFSIASAQPHGRTDLALPRIQQIALALAVAVTVRNHIRPIWQYLFHQRAEAALQED